MTPSELEPETVVSQAGTAVYIRQAGALTNRGGKVLQLLLSHRGQGSGNYWFQS